MASRFVLFFAFAVACANAQLQTVNGRIKITTVTTAGCSDTVNFIGNQLGPVYAEFGHLLDIEFVPWGRTVNNNGAFTCQFGTADCWANRLHRCVVSMLGFQQDRIVDYMLCEFSSPYPSYLGNSYQCAATTGLNLVDVDYCVASQPGDKIDTAAQVAALEPMQIINFVPAIVFNDQPVVSLHTQARTNLRSLVCVALAADPTTGVTSCTL